MNHGNCHGTVAPLLQHPVGANSKQRSPKRFLHRAERGSKTVRAREEECSGIRCKHILQLIVIRHPQPHKDHAAMSFTSSEMEISSRETRLSILPRQCSWTFISLICSAWMEDGCSQSVFQAWQGRQPRKNRVAQRWLC